MSAGNAEGEHIVMECAPNCYAKVVEAVSKTQHAATQDKLDAIIANQTTLIHGVNQVVTVIANLANLSKNLDDHKAEAEKKFDDVFKRLRKVETYMAWFMGVVGSIVGILETLRMFHII
jgi:predicted methyltransferase